ncbi:thiamine pyrophosphate-binding protein [Streptomyces vietnamensis]|uniref:thiamine pyrophosphate-binding protein n=1 Tax=Streptomyces vietnamensis TaxID=362257 RepID=UPI003792DD06
MSTFADHVIASLQASGVRRPYGLPGDSPQRSDGRRPTRRRRRPGTRQAEGSAALAAAAEAGLTGEPTVCVDSCGPGNLHPVNGLFDARRSRVPVLAGAATPRHRDRRRPHPGPGELLTVPDVVRISTVVSLREEVPPRSRALIERAAAQRPRPRAGIPIRE